MSTWSDWQLAQFNECYIRGIGPAETAAFLGKSKEDVCAKARELGFLLSEESPATAPDEPVLFPTNVAAS